MGWDLRRVRPGYMHTDVGMDGATSVAGPGRSLHAATSCAPGAQQHLEVLEAGRSWHLYVSCWAKVR